MILKKLTNKLPYQIKQPFRYMYGTTPPSSIRYGKVFWETYNFLQESQWWSKQKLEEYQLKQLSKLVHHAYENVPYYRKIFRERGLKPKDIHDFDDFTLKVKDVLDNYEQYKKRLETVKMENNSEKILEVYKKLLED